MIKKPVLAFLIAAGHFANAQKCSCADNFAWLKETFEKNDAGFQYVIGQKGQADYKKHSDIYTEKVKTITDQEACADAMIEWLRYFRKGHLWLRPINIKESPQAEKADQSKIKEQYKNWESYPYNEKEFKAYLATLKTPGLEGIWNSPPYTIGVKKVKNEYLGFIIEADGIYWSRSQVKFKIKEENGKLSAIYYMQNHTAQTLSEVKLLGNNYLNMDFVNLKRVAPAFPADEKIDLYFTSMRTRTPFFEKLSDKTTLLRIPSFDGSFKKQIDSVVQANMKTLTGTENLIIDLRNNGGGSDASFAKLIPLIYTDPIRTVGLEFLSSPLNNKRMENFINDPEADEEDKKWAREAFEKLNKNLGKFVSLDEQTIGVDTLDKIYEFPKHVGIIINGGDGSTTEQFLLAAKQSKKVKLFGTTTFGSLDISNMYSVKSTCGDYELGYCLSKSKRIPDFTIDGKGIQPDFYLDKTIPDHEWVNFVNTILSK
jgi:hypothetical protein